MARTVADLMAETLRSIGVRRVYGVVGDSLNGFTDALRRQKEIQWCICGTRRRPRSLPAPKRILPVSWRFAQEAAAPAICI